MANCNPKNQFQPRNPEIQELIFKQCDAIAKMDSAEQVTVFLKNINSENDKLREQRRELVYRLDHITEKEEANDHLVDAAHAKLAELQSSSIGDIKGANQIAEVINKSSGAGIVFNFNFKGEKIA